MRKHYNINNLLFLTLLSAVTACSSEDNFRILTSRTPIQLTVGVEGPKSRAAVITDEIADKTHAFGSETGIWMVMQSKYVTIGNDKDFQGDHDAKYCVTYGTTGTAQDNVNPVSITGDNIRYWDDIHARSSALSVWALAVPGKTGGIGSWNSAAGWGSDTPSKTITWTVATTQTSETMAANDLCFSNNIADYTSQTKGDRRMKFNTETSKFAEGRLVFYHALSKITIKMVAGAGFKHDGTDFKFDDGGISGTSAPVKLKGFNTSGTFDVADGSFSASATSSSVIDKMHLNSTKSTNNPYYELEALVVPGNDLTTGDDAISFSIDGNRFKISAATLKAKLVEGGATSFAKLESGKNYIFQFTLNKTAISVTATVKDWDEINAANEAPKINVTDNYGEEGTAFTKDYYTFFRSTNLNDNYFADSKYSNSSSALTPQLYWPDHDTHYFFRGIWPEMTTIPDANKVASTETGGYKAIKVANGQYTANTCPSDLMIGYPRTESVICKSHSQNVAQYGICATEGVIRMNFQYVMSWVEVKLETNKEASATNKVTFDQYTNVEILGCYTDGAIKLSDGTADFTGKTKATSWTMPLKDTDYANRQSTIVPQSLEGLRFKITIKGDDDKNDSYETVLGIANIPVTIDGIEKSITAWEPGKHYVYTLTITKTGIRVTATIKDWITATGSTNIWM